MVPLPIRALTDAPPDAIFGISSTFALDPRPNKVNLAVGVYVDETAIRLCFRPSSTQKGVS